jgi:4-alpha-glucanotransferase
MTINFYIRFSTKFGQSLLVSGNTKTLGYDDITQAVSLQYFNDEFWYGKVEITEADFNTIDIEYRYILKDVDGSTVLEWGNDRVIELSKAGSNEIILIDTWNHAGEIENAFFTKAFQDVLLKSKSPLAKLISVQIITHEFKVKAPLLRENEVVCIAGSGVQLGDWKTNSPLLLSKEGNWWTIKLNIENETFPIAYKYGIYNTSNQTFVAFESGKNRTLYSDRKSVLTIIHDGVAQFGFPNWKGAGVAIPVFSLRSNSGFGTGEFADIKLLVDWAKIGGLKLIQLLPINDTTATHTALDSYPYAAISAFCLASFIPQSGESRQ